MQADLQHPMYTSRAAGYVSSLERPTVADRQELHAEQMLSVGIPAAFFDSELPLGPSADFQSHLVAGQERPTK